jgi:hypothetical protein
MAKTPMLKMPKPKAEINASSAARRPVPTAKGKDIISITTRMRETPMVLKGKPKEAMNFPKTGTPTKDKPMPNIMKNDFDLAAELMKKKGK